MTKRLLQKIRPLVPDAFITAFMLVIILAYFVPDIGTGSKWFNLAKISDFGIAILFFFYGLRLSPEKMLEDLKDWRLHVIVQTITFVVFPILLLLFYPFFRNTENEIFWLSVFFLSALPSTVTASVVMVSIAEGNISASIFNASISGIIGIFITPMWMGFFIGGQSESFEYSTVIRDLVIQILLPVLLGLFMHRFWGKWGQRNKKYLSFFDKTIVLSIVYQSFSHSFQSGVFRSFPRYKLIILACCVLALFFIVFEGVKFLTHQLKFNREDRIAILFCGSKKSLIHGTTIASIMFAGSGKGGFFLVPVMIYHAFQLFYVSMVARKYGADNHKKNLLSENQQETK